MIYSKLDIVIYYHKEANKWFKYSSALKRRTILASSYDELCNDFKYPVTDTTQVEDSGWIVVNTFNLEDFISFNK